MRPKQSDDTPLQRVTELAYRELRRIAAAMMSRERAGHTLQPTALVHAAFLRLTRSSEFAVDDRSEFVSMAAHTMRCILVDHARKRGTLKRGGDRLQLTLDEVDSAAPSKPLDLLELDEALSRLSRVDERQHRIVELRFFGGLKNREVADLLDVSERTVEDDWRLARMWLKRELSGA